MFNYLIESVLEMINRSFFAKEQEKLLDYELPKRNNECFDGCYKKKENTQSKRKKSVFFGLVFEFFVLRN